MVTKHFSNFFYFAMLVISNKNLKHKKNKVKCNLLANKRTMKFDIYLVYSIFNQMKVQHKRIFGLDDCWLLRYTFSNGHIIFFFFQRAMWIAIPHTYSFFNSSFPEVIACNWLLSSLPTNFFIIWNLPTSKVWYWYH